MKNLLSPITSRVSTLPAGAWQHGKDESWAELSPRCPGWGCQCKPSEVHPPLWDQHGAFTCPNTQQITTFSQHHFPLSHPATGHFWMLPCWFFLECLNIYGQGVFGRRKDAGDWSSAIPSCWLPCRHAHPHGSILALTAATPTVLRDTARTSDLI